MEDKTQILYKTLTDQGLYTKTFDDFTTQFSDPAKRQLLHKTLNEKGLYTKTYEDFDNQFFPVKKKDFSEASLSGETSVLPLTEPLPQPQPSPFQQKLKSLDVIPKEELPQAVNDLARSHKEDNSTVMSGILDNDKKFDGTLRGYLKLRNVTPKMLGLPEGQNLDRDLREGDIANYDDLLAFKGLYQKPQAPNLFWGTVKRYNLGTAQFFRSLDNATKSLSNMTGIKRGGFFGDIADYIEWHESNLPDNPDTFTGNVLGGAASMSSLFLELAVTPQFKFKAVGKILKVPKLITQMVGSTAVNRYAEAIPEDNAVEVKTMVEGIKGAGAGAIQGSLFTVLGYGSGALGEMVGKTTKSAATGLVTSVGANAAGFAGYDAVQQLLEKGNIDWDQTTQQGAMGAVLGFPAMAKWAGTRAWGNLMTASKDAMSLAQKLKYSPEDGRKKAFDIRQKAMEEQDMEKRASMESTANALDALIDIKTLGDEVIQDPSKFIKIINSDPDLTVAEKQLYANRINEIVSDRMRSPSVALLENELTSLREELSNQEVNTSISDAMREINTKSIKEKIRNHEKTLINLINKRTGKTEIQQSIADLNDIEFVGQQKDEDGNPALDMYNVVVDGKPNTFTVKIAEGKTFEEQNEAVVKKIEKYKPKKEEEVKNAKSDGTSTEKGSEQAPKLEQGEEERLRLRPNEGNRMETQPGEEIIPVQKPQEFTALEHKQNIEQKFRDVFTGKNIPQEQVDGAIALMNARANSWASEETGRTPEQWYDRIADIKEGEFQDKSTPKLYQLPDGRQVMGLISPEVTNGFYSPIEKRLADFKQEKASVNKWKEIIGKGDEATFTGVLDYLNKLKPDQSLTKAEINQFLKDNRIEVVEVTKGMEGGSRIPPNVVTALEEMDYLGFDSPAQAMKTIRQSKDTWRKDYDITEDDIQRADIIDSYVNENQPTKFSQYQLPGEKENYKEVLVTMPVKNSDYKVVKGSVGNKYYIERSDGETIGTYDNEESANKGLATLNEQDHGAFKSSHFDEPNILVHLRMNTRTDADGKKVLFLEEVQSDWAEIGRKEGFFKPQDKELDNKIQEVTNKLADRGITVVRGGAGYYHFENKAGIEILGTSMNKEDLQLANEFINLIGQKKTKASAPPTAPFVTDTNAWTKLGLKVALKEAIKQGVDKISWTTGEQQNERYDLSKQVESVMLSLDGSLSVVKKGEDNYTVIAGNIREPQLADYIGKEAAQKLSEQKPNDNGDKILSGVDLKLGGKGMIGFYGSPEGNSLGIVGNIAKSLFKQEPKTTNMATKDVNVDEKMVRKDGVPIEYKEARNFNFDGSDLLYAQKEGGSLHRIHSFFELGLAKDERLLRVSPETTIKQHSIDITPALKAEVEKGLPLFQKEGKDKPKGAVETLADGKLVIHALNRPDFSTMVHEIIHTFERDLNDGDVASLEKWSGAKRGTTPYKEKFARAGERYLRNGESPNEALKPIFEKFKQWLTAIYRELKGSPIGQKLSPDIKKIFDRLLTEAPVEKTPITGQTRTPETGTISSETGNVPPEKIVPPTETTEGGVGETKFRQTQTNALIQDQTLQQKAVAEIVDTNKERYTVLHGEKAIISAKKMIDEQGVANATIDLAERTKHLDDFPTRQVGRMVLLDFYSRAITDRNATESDKTMAFKNLDRLQQIMAREATKAGQGNAMLAIWKSMQPSGLLEFVGRKIADSNNKALAKKLGDSTVGQQLDELYKTLSDESKKIIGDIIAGREIKIEKEGEIPVRTTPKPRSTALRERITREQTYRKSIIEQYKKTQEGVASASLVGLTSAQIELGGNLLGSYVREANYRVQEVIDKLISDFKEAGIDLSKEQADGLLKQKKDEKETFEDYIGRKESVSDKRAAEKLISKKINDVLREHWTEKDELKRTLAQKLIEELGLSESDAKKIEKETLDSFDKEIVKRSQSLMTKLIGTSKIPVEKAQKGLMQKMIELVNMGALDEGLYRDLFAEKFNLTKLTDQHKMEILKLADNVQQASGHGWLERDATIKLAKYIYELYPKGKANEILETWTSLTYANMLMGLSTTALNIWSQGSNMTLKPVRDLVNLSRWLHIIKNGKKGEGTDAYNPFGEMFYVPMIEGRKMGWNEAKEVYLNGDLNNKYVEDVAKKGQFRVTPLERNKYGKSKRFKPWNVKIGNATIDMNLGNAYKYAGRNLAAQDKLMLTTSYDTEVVRILRDKLRTSDLTGRALTKAVMDIYRGEHIDQKELDAQLESDVQLHKKLTGEDMSEIQKKIRKRELVLDKLPLTKEEKEEAEKLARSSIFTDERSGLFGTLAHGLNIAVNSSPVAGVIFKPFIPFTTIVGNVAESMVDYTPFYGFMRANGLGFSAMKKLINPEWGTSQMGEKGSRAYYEQMGRAWFGTLAFGAALAFFLDKKEDSFLEISGGYSAEGFKKPGRANVMPQYTLRIGSVKIPYMNIPALAIPLAIIGNINDGLRAGVDEGDLRDRLTLSLLFDASMQSITMVKDMSFVDGVQRLATMIGDAASTDEKKLGKIGTDMAKTYLGFALRPLPQNNNAVQQIWKIFDPTSYLQSDIKSILAYSAGLQHFVNKPNLDQLGDVVKTYPGETLLPYTHWLNIKGKDERWKFLAEHNAIPGKGANRVFQIETKDGIEKRKLDEDELYDYTDRAGELFSNYLMGYKANADKVAKRGAEIIEREKTTGEIEKITGIQEDMEKAWAKAKDDAETELFKWGSIKEDMPNEWELIKKNKAYHPYQASKTTGDYKWDKSELYLFNNLVTLRYAEKIKGYLSGSKAQTDKTQPSHQKKEITKFEDHLNTVWDDAQTYVSNRMDKQIRAKIKEAEKPTVKK